MKRKVLCLAVLGLTALARLGAALAQCGIQETPAATLLLPYFEVDLSTSTGKTTQVTVGNAFSSGALVEAVVWSDLGVPISSFDIYLNGYQDVRFDLRDILEGGRLPQTQPPAGTHPSCNGFMPPAPIPLGTLASYQQALIGGPVPAAGNLCAGRNLGDTIARGYITFDIVNACTLQIQTDPGVFAAGGTATFSNQNSLFGDFQYVTTSTGLAEEHPLVHIVADGNAAPTSTAGKYTFYGKDVSWQAVDNREPLATEFAARFLAAGTDVIVWRDSKVAQSYFTCGSLPSWYPLGQESAWAMADSGTYSFIGTKPFPAVAQRVRVGGAALPVPYSSGWLYLDLNTSVAAAPGAPPFDPTVSQAWVMTSSTVASDVALGNNAVRYDSACAPRHYGP
ncbi:MAG: hypothetical protein M3O15_02955 [Acidobacteriota bacterium]|nr:hypothetical protein [Acidobacteriota bacterium]